MRVLMIQNPTLERDHTVPFGLLYAASAARRAGHDVRIVDPVAHRLDLGAVLDVFRDFGPDVVGMGGITASYRSCKETTRALREVRKDVPIVVGGVLASVADLLLERAGADFIVHGEGEVSFHSLLEALAARGDVARVQGISFRHNGASRRTPPQPQVANLDDIPMPDFDLLDVPKYLEHAQSWLDHYFPKDDPGRREVAERLVEGEYMFPIMTARGCTHRCIFCYRHQRGLRQHGVPYVVAMMRHLRDRYGVRIVSINDELTTANRKWVFEFCDALDRERLGMCFIVLSARVTNVDEEMLRRLKASGCLMVNYGYESGSNVILDEIEKGVTREQALKAGLLTKRAGIKNVPEIIIGFPSETRETVAETIDFLQRLDVWPISVNTPIPFPETPLWDTAVKRGFIGDKEEFVMGYKRLRFINFTRLSDAELLRLVRKVHFMVRASWLWNRGCYLAYLRCLAEGWLACLLRPLVPEGLYAAARKTYLRILPRVAA